MVYIRVKHFIRIAVAITERNSRDDQILGFSVIYT